ncbi:hypothetical protein Q4S45_21455 [Massilia sp. R2A-15]|uniref:hypothetical protein n=1 Tax=Massilia sp. R2A-15 TaxID=3064278 RepID=UPI002736B301|nr:hypothetical protein [Massilia sp. R2A-15]WLI89231.1 hypothetical protein Q4S45_21455 [Massilia sp. R2A-15]
MAYPIPRFPNADLVRALALRRAVLAATGEETDMAVHVLDAAQRKLATLAETRSEHEPVRASAAMVPYTARVDGEVGVQGIATGLIGDALLNGGPNRSNLIIIGPLPSSTRRTTSPATPPVQRGTGAFNCRPADFSAQVDWTRAP